MMKVEDFLNQVRKAVNSKTLYVMGGWGFPLNSSNKDRTQKNSYNQREERKKKIYAASSDTFAFDCVGLCKGVLWGWDAKADLKNGGASYAANGVPDWDAKVMMFSGCSDPTTDFSKIDAGEFLWLDGHCGIYLGDGLAAESTPIWKDGVQITAVSNIGTKPGYNSRKWTYHGHLKYVDYSGVTPEPDPKELDGFEVGKTYEVICNDPLMIRKGPAQSYDKVGELKKGDRIVCMHLRHDGSGNTWLDHEKGWSCGLYKGQRYLAEVQPVKDGWVKSGGKWYYYKDGRMLKSAWIIDKGDKYYLGADGAMLTGWQTIDRLEYYFYSDGHMACDEWLGGYFINMDGNKDGTKGAWKSNSKGKWWQTSDGRYPKNRSVRISKKDYQFDKNGYLIT